METATAIDGLVVACGDVHEAGRLVMWVWGRAADGRTFALRDTRFVPYFFVPRGEAHRVPTGAGVRVVPSESRALHGGPVVRVEGRSLHELRGARDALVAAGVACYEADLRPTSRYLIDRGLRGAVAVTGRTRPPPSSLSVDLLFDDPEIAPIDDAAEGAFRPPTLSILSIDIETTPDAGRVLSIALHEPAGQADEVLLLSPDGAARPEARAFTDERALLSAFVASVRRRDPDIVTGWNVIDFDLTVLAARCRAHGLRLGIGRDGSEPRIQTTRSFFGSSSATVSGRLVLDGIALVRGSFVQLDEYGLDAVARRFLGEGKTIEAAAGGERVDEIQRLYRDDPARFVAYNLRDAQLVPRILDKLGLVGLAVQRSLITGMTPDRVAASIASFDSLYLPELNRRGVVAPSVDGEAAGAEPQQGGLVLASEAGLHQNVFVFDFKSLYPSVIRTFQIDPLGHVVPGDPDAETVDAISAPGGARFRRQGAILPAILDRLFPRREAAKRRGDEVASHAIKILMNSLYGVLGASACRFYDADLANAITGFGREILLWTKARIEAGGRRVLYGDTDSLFVLAAPSDDPLEAHGRQLVARLNEELAAHLRERYRVESRLELEFDTLYARLHLPTMRGDSGEGARKRYAGLAVDGERTQVVFTGMEAVRRDGTELGRVVQRELYERLFHDREVIGYLKDVVARLRRGELDELLVYRKALRKPLESYIASTPPHVAAARKLQGPVGRTISYVITTAGPEPVSEQRHPLDRGHYLDKQLRPIAEPVLDLLGLGFEVVSGAPVQLRLF